MYPAGNAILTGNRGTNSPVVLLSVVAGSVICPICELFPAEDVADPLFIHILATVRMLVPSGSQMTSSTQAPFDPAVNRVETVPVPSCAVFAVAETAAHEIFGVSGNSGDVFAGIGQDYTTKGTFVVPLPE